MLLCNAPSQDGTTTGNLCRSLAEHVAQHIWSTNAGCPFRPSICDGQLAFQQDPDFPLWQGGCEGSIGSLVHHPEQIQHIHLHLLLLVVCLLRYIT